uniref:Uncharacterized protein n=1 Tax=viral metagenome TaxID=1070528 RepID=A0A6C0HM17_9ZZZZ
MVFIKKRSRGKILLQMQGNQLFKMGAKKSVKKSMKNSIKKLRKKSVKNLVKNLVKKSASMQKGKFVKNTSKKGFISSVMRGGSVPKPEGAPKSKGATEDIKPKGNGNPLEGNKKQPDGPVKPPDGPVKPLEGPVKFNNLKTNGQPPKSPDAPGTPGTPGTPVDPVAAAAAVVAGVVVPAPGGLTGMFESIKSMVKSNPEMISQLLEAYKANQFKILSQQQQNRKANTSTAATTKKANNLKGQLKELQNPKPTPTTMLSRIFAGFGGKGSIAERAKRSKEIINELMALDKLAKGTNGQHTNSTATSIAKALSKLYSGSWNNTKPDANSVAAGNAVNGIKLDTAANGTKLVEGNGNGPKSGEGNEPKNDTSAAPSGIPP